MTREDVLKDLTQLACFAADGPVIAATTATGAQRTRIGITAALDALERQGYITFAPVGEWPEHFEIARHNP